MSRNKQKPKSRLTRRGWYRPAGDKVNTLLDTWQRELEIIADSFLRHFKANLPKGASISCKPGCSYCCQAAFICTSLEGLLIARHLLSFWSGKDLTELRDKLEEHQIEQEELGAAGWFEKKEACPFLSDSHCLVYKVRPLNCRTCWAIGDPILCDEGRAPIANDAVAERLRIERGQLLMKRLVGRPNVVTATLPGAVSLGMQSLVSGDYDVRGAPLEGEAKEAFVQKWVPPSLRK